jgi:cleavage and polyadenylation specificity factor subunit 4
MKGDTCGFLHEFDPERMPVCKNLLKFGQCKEADCPYKHTTDSIKECNMYKLGFCIYGPACRFKHTRATGPPPDPSRLEACKPKEYRNINIGANQATEGILPDQNDPNLLTDGKAMGSRENQTLALPGYVDPSLLASVGQRDLRYGF